MNVAFNLTLTLCSRCAFVAIVVHRFAFIHSSFALRWCWREDDAQDASAKRKTLVVLLVLRSSE